MNLRSIGKSHHRVIEFFQYLSRRDHVYRWILHRSGARFGEDLADQIFCILGLKAQQKTMATDKHKLFLPTPVSGESYLN